LGQSLGVSSLGGGMLVNLSRWCGGAYRQGSRQFATSAMVLDVGI
jgi:hypothetical protein